jgi:hypothetical protein
MRLRLRPGVWSELEDHLNAVGLKTIGALSDSSFSLDQSITALRFTRQYLVYRNARPCRGYPRPLLIVA